MDTAGQPGLVCGICKDLVEKFCTDRTKTIRMEDYWKCLDYYLKEKIDKNISNIVAKAKQEKELMIKILFSEEVRLYFSFMGLSLRAKLLCSIVFLKRRARKKNWISSL